MEYDTRNLSSRIERFQPDVRRGPTSFCYNKNMWGHQQRRAQFPHRWLDVWHVTSHTHDSTDALVLTCTNAEKLFQMTINDCKCRLARLLVRDSKYITVLEIWLLGLPRPSPMAITAFTTAPSMKTRNYPADRSPLIDESPLGCATLE